MRTRAGFIKIVVRNARHQGTRRPEVRDGRTDMAMRGVGCGDRISGALRSIKCSSPLSFPWLDPFQAYSHIREDWELRSTMRGRLTHVKADTEDLTDALSPRQTTKATLSLS